MEQTPKVKGHPQSEATRKKISRTLRGDKRGRPTVDTPETRRKIEEAAAIDASVEEIAFYADISRDSFYEIMKKDKAFSDRVEALRNRPIMKARQTIVKSLEDPNYAFKYLEKKRKTEFGNALDITTGGDKLSTNKEQADLLIASYLNGNSEHTQGE